MEILVVVSDPAAYRAAIDAWRPSATVVQELAPWVAVVIPHGDAPDVPGTRWYTGAVPADVLLSLDPPARIFIAAWLDRRHAKARPRDDGSWDPPLNL
jgi:hypothetical protein